MFREIDGPRVCRGLVDGEVFGMLLVDIPVALVAHPLDARESERRTATGGVGVEGGARSVVAAEGIRGRDGGAAIRADVIVGGVGAADIAQVLLHVEAAFDDDGDVEEVEIATGVGVGAAPHVEGVIGDGGRRREHVAVDIERIDGLARAGFGDGDGLGPEVGNVIEGHGDVIPAGGGALEQALADVDVVVARVGVPGAGFHFPNRTIVAPHESRHVTRAGFFARLTHELERTTGGVAARVLGRELTQGRVTDEEGERAIVKRCVEVGVLKRK